MKHYLFVVRNTGSSVFPDTYTFSCFTKLEDAIKVMDYWKQKLQGRFCCGDFRIYESENTFGATIIHTTAPVVEHEFHTDHELSNRDFDSLWKEDHPYRIAVKISDCCEFEIGWFFKQETADTMFDWLKTQDDGNEYKENLDCSKVKNKKKVVFA